MNSTEPPIRVVNLLPDPRVGGPQHRVAQVAQKMLAYGVHTTVIIPPGPAVEFFRDWQIPCIPFEFPRVRRSELTASAVRTYLGLPLDSKRLARSMRCNGTSILHCNGLMTLVGPLAARMARVKVLWHLNDTLLPPLVYSTTLKAFSRLVDRIVFSSHAVGHYARYNKEIEVVYPPVDLDRFSDRSPASKSILAQHGLSLGLPTLVSVGNINRSKGYEHLLEAIAILKHRGLVVQSLIVGVSVDGRVREALERVVVKYGMQSQVRFVGGTNSVEQYYKAATVLVLPSISEAMPMSLLEAMASGLPCVATQVGGVEEILHNRDNGMLVAPAQPGEMASAIEELIQDSNKATEMGAKAARSVGEKCSLESIARQQASIYFDMTRLASVA